MKKNNTTNMRLEPAALDTSHSTTLIMVWLSPTQFYMISVT